MEKYTETNTKAHIEAHIELHINNIIRCINQNKLELPDFQLISILEICIDLTKDYDKSHDIIHHINVMINAITIHTHTNLSLAPKDKDRVLKLIVYASLLHDTIDHKYPTNIDTKIIRLNTFLKKELGGDWSDVKWIIDNISYSKEIKNGYPIHSDPIIQLSRDIVSDADKLEAIGSVGFMRCYQFTKISNPLANEDKLSSLVIEHCHDKLLKLKDNFIRTNYGKLMAEPLHQILLDYVKIYS